MSWCTFWGAIPHAIAICGNINLAVLEHLAFLILFMDSDVVNPAGSVYVPITNGDVTFLPLTELDESIFHGA